VGIKKRNAYKMLATKMMNLKVDALTALNRITVANGVVPASFATAAWDAVGVF